MARLHDLVRITSSGSGLARVVEASRYDADVWAARLRNDARARIAQRIAALTRDDDPSPAIMS